MDSEKIPEMGAAELLLLVEDKMQITAAKIAAAEATAKNAVLNLLTSPSFSIVVISRK
jgi:hypothetical protein